ncbi:hypothetical protein [Mucilaginibacter myungsuensis]|uniref:Uncharacterized protein n=1 Tax=Mucilaginibacter myungsuensis TaxID=649104 RepID=A0A929KXQ1_9SPHI|nr:hypothetical protein [Mucilaginibacter myungsuensis]MBE9663581.1 hypothetical protein [Mucilaginibacter myungsuensis]MDN3599095.1 hypothetical protein [Mucilaginibacter myungsuensis]
MSTSKNATQSNKKTDDDDKELKTEAPISEKDEVKKAEDRTNEAAKAGRSNAGKK